MPESDSADLAADRVLVAEWQRLTAGTTPGLWFASGLRLYSFRGRAIELGDAAWIAHAHESTLAERFAARLDEVEELRREVVRLRAPLPHPRGGLLR